MKMATVRELRQNFGSLLKWLEEGQEVGITMRRRLVARLVPEHPASRAKARTPDFLKRMRRIHGDVALDGNVAQEILEENKGQW